MCVIDSVAATFAGCTQYCLARQSLRCGEHIGMTFSWSIKPVKRLIPRQKERKPRATASFSARITAKRLDPKTVVSNWPPLFPAESQSVYSSCLGAVYLKGTASWKHQLIQGMELQNHSSRKPHRYYFNGIIYNVEFTRHAEAACTIAQPTLQHASASPIPLPILRTSAG